MARSVPLPADIALIPTTDLPDGSVRETQTEAAYSTYAEWAPVARPYLLDRARQPGAFTTFEAFAAAPKNVREPISPHWHGRLAVEFHDDGVIDYARDEHGTERWSKSQRPKTAKSGVRMWVGAAFSAVAA